MKQEDRLILNFIGEEYEFLEKLREFFPKKEDFDRIVDFKRWAWIMPVVEKINMMDDYAFTVIIKSMEVGIYDNRTNKVIFESKSKWQPDELIEAVYEAVVEFLKWYNDEGEIEWHEEEPVHFYTLVYKGVELQVTYSKNPHIGGITITPLSRDAVTKEAREFAEKKINEIFKIK